MLKIGFIGGGKMAQAMAKGFLSANLTKGENIIASCHPSDIQSHNAFKQMGGQSTYENPPVIEQSDVVVLSVKPTIFPCVVEDLKKHKKIQGDKLYLSIMMGVTLKKLEQSLPPGNRVIRAMTNTPALVGSAASVYSRGIRATDKDVDTCRNLLKAIGTCEEVQESLMDPITALSGSGPAYVYVLIESLADGGVKMGLPRELAYRLASQTVLGAGKMVLTTNTHPGILKDNVSSPAGSTASALHFLEITGFRAAVIGAVETASKRATEVSKSLEN